MKNKINIPRLRFPEFRDGPEWEEKRLGDICTRITEKVGNQTLITVSISAGIGFVSQAEKFSRNISGKQYKNYIVLNKGDFSYNKGNSKKYPQGCIYRLKEFQKAAVPNAFISFRFDENYIPDFFRGYFDRNYHGRQLVRFITSGARSDGLLNINPHDFFSIILPTPVDKKEQQKIADCLSSLDQLIDLHTKKLKSLKEYKKGLMQQLFPAEGVKVPRLRFPEFRGGPEWEEKEIKDFAQVTTGSKDTQDRIDQGEYPFYVRSQKIERIDTYSYDGEAILTSGDGVGVGKNYHYIVGKFDFHQRVYCICDFSKMVSGKFFFHYFSEHFYKRVMRLSAKNSVDSIRKAMITLMRIPLPEFNEQQKIADCLSSLDDLITAQTQKINSLKEHKKGLMQGLFPAGDKDSRSGAVYNLSRTAEQGGLAAERITGWEEQ